MTAVLLLVLAPALAAAQSGSNMDQMHEYAQKLDKERAAKAEADAKAKANSKEKAEHCRSARERKQIMDDHPRWKVPDGQGQLRTMTDAEHAAAQREIDKEIADACGR